MAGYEQLSFRLKATSALQKIQAGELVEGLADLDKLFTTADPAQKMQLTTLKLTALLKAEKYDDAATVLTDITESKDVTPVMLNQLGWGVYEAAEDQAEFPEELIAAAIAAAEKAVAEEPMSGMILDTLAHLVYLQGNLDRALELQTQAVENSEEAPADSRKEMSSFLRELKEEKAGK